MLLQIKIKTLNWAGFDSFPVNVVNVSKSVSISNLAEAGVKRISMAVLLHWAAYAKAERTAKETLFQ